MLFHHEPLYKNATISILKRISALWLKPKKEREITQRHVESLRIKTSGVDQLLGHLSGGNQQKVALAKWLTHAPKVLILNEPTRGMDVGAKEDVVNILRGLRDAGMAVVVASTEPETILSLADRIVVMKKGTIVKEFSTGTVSKDRLLEAA
jgi:ribose transport system ATP-binding protein